MTAKRFPIRIGARSAMLVRLAFGATTDTAWAEVDADGLRARFGRFRFETPLANIASWRIEGPFRWITAIGVRTSVRHRDRSFAGQPARRRANGLPRPGWQWSPGRCPAFYVGVDDLAGFAAALSALGIPGEDARRG